MKKTRRSSPAFAKGPLTPREYGAALRALRVIERAGVKMVGVIPTQRFNESLSWIRTTIEEYG